MSESEINPRPVCGCIEPKGIFSFLQSSWQENNLIEDDLKQTSSSSALLNNNDVVEDRKEIKEILNNESHTSIPEVFTLIFCQYIISS